jgi:hypothetical protein
MNCEDSLAIRRNLDSLTSCEGDLPLEYTPMGIFNLLRGRATMSVFGNRPKPMASHTQPGQQHAAPSTKEGKKGSEQTPKEPIKQAEPGKKAGKGCCGG